MWPHTALLRAVSGIFGILESQQWHAGAMQQEHDALHRRVEALTARVAALERQKAAAARSPVPAPLLLSRLPISEP
jgi:hypothetical protein